MSSLWTPSGEHEVPPQSTAPERGTPTADAQIAEPGSTAGPASADAAGEAAIDPEVAAEMEERMRQAQEQVIAMPASQIVTNHVLGLFELAALHLRRDPPALEQARLPIDAMALLVENLSDELAEPETLQTALQQIRMAFVSASNAAGQDTAGQD